MTAIRRSFCWALEPSFAERPPGTPQRWWLVELINGEPVRAFLPPDRADSAGDPELRESVSRDSFVRWDLRDVPAPTTRAPVCNYTLGPKGPLR